MIVLFPNLKQPKKWIVHHKREKYDVLITRDTKWGNPFHIGRDGTRKQVIEKYRKWIRTQPELLACLHELEGKVLGCWCDPKRCHGEVLRDLLAERNRMKGR